MTENKIAQKWNDEFFLLLSLAWQMRDEPCVIKVKLETRTHSSLIWWWASKMKCTTHGNQANHPEYKTERRTKRTKLGGKNGKNLKWKCFCCLNQFNRSQCVIPVCSVYVRERKKCLSNYFYCARLCESGESHVCTCSEWRKLNSFMCE